MSGTWKTMLVLTPLDRLGAVGAEELRLAARPERFLGREMVVLADRKAEAWLGEPLGQGAWPRQGERSRSAEAWEREASRARLG